MSVHEITEQALALPPEERMELLNRLCDSLPEVPHDEELAAELARREAEAAEDPDAWIDGEEVLSQARNRHRP